MNTVTLDVREDIREGREPFSKIMSAVESLGPEDQLLLVAPFQPVPLYRVLGGKGFTHSATATETGDWEVLFTRSERKPAPAAPAKTSTASPEPEVIDVDARGLEPPQPFVHILEAVEAAAKGSRLRARTDRQPLHLFDELTSRGCSYTSEQEADGSYVTTILKS